MSGMRISKLFPRKVGTIALAAVTAVCAGTVMMIPGIAAATVTVTPLTAATFATTTVPTGQWMLPTTVPANQGCLTAGTSAAPTSIPECTPTTDTSGNGALQLTTNSNTEVGTVFNTTSLPSNQGLDVSFNTYQFDPATPPPGGADGISFALVASNPANPQPPASGGPSGGSLGYSTNQSAAGIPDGYLGFGLDVFGNFLNTTSGGTTCPADGSIGNSTYPQSVTVRGPGDGGTGYCVVATTASTSSPSSTNNLPGGTGTLDSTSATTHSSSVPVEIALNPSSSTATTASGLSVPADDFLVAFTPVGGTRQTLSGTLPSLIGNSLGIPAAWYNATTGLPYQLTFGWSASTGSHNEFHEISTLTSSTLNGPLPKLQLTDADNSSGVLMQGPSSSDMVLTPS